MAIQKLLPSHPFLNHHSLTIGDFWSWAYSNVLDNTIRSVLAEFIVGYALDVVDHPRLEWDAVDLRYSGKKIEVKCSAYIQSWEQHSKHSTIRFDIGKKKAWDAETNVYTLEPIRSADCYVFCLYTEMDKMSANPLDLAKWEFYVVHSDQIEQYFAMQKEVALSRIKALCSPVHYQQLKQEIDTLFGL